MDKIQALQYTDINFNATVAKIIIEGQWHIPDYTRNQNPGLATHMVQYEMEGGTDERVRTPTLNGEYH